MAKILELKSNRAPGSWQGLKVEPGNLANRNRGASCALCRHRRSRELRALSANEEGESVSPSHQSSATNPSVVRGGRFTVAPFTRRVLTGAAYSMSAMPRCDQVLHRNEMSRWATAQSRCAPARCAGARAERPVAVERTAIARWRGQQQACCWCATHDRTRLVSSCGRLHHWPHR